MTVSNIETTTVPYGLSFLFSHPVAKELIIVPAETIMVTAPCMPSSTCSSADMTGQLEPINESGRPSEMNTRYMTASSKADISAGL